MDTFMKHKGDPIQQEMGDFDLVNCKDTGTRVKWYALICDFGVQRAGSLWNFDCLSDCIPQDRIAFCPPHMTRGLSHHLQWTKSEKCLVFLTIMCLNLRSGNTFLHGDMLNVSGSTEGLQGRNWNGRSLSLGQQFMDHHLTAPCSVDVVQVHTSILYIYCLQGTEHQLPSFVRGQFVSKNNYILLLNFGEGLEHPKCKEWGMSGVLLFQWVIVNKITNKVWCMHKQTCTYYQSP